MRAIATQPRTTLRYSILTGSILLMGWTLFGSTGIKNESIQPDGSAQSRQASQKHSRWFQLGRASWYGFPFQGQITASGEIYDMYQMTCAHRSLPLGALVRITNLRNHRSVVVRVNDRGPLVESRIVDVSYGAARVLGFHGMTRVRLDLVDPSPTAAEVASLRFPEPSRN